MEQYIERIKQLENPSFQQIRKIASDSISHLTKEQQDLLWEQLDRGVKELTTHEELCMYLRAFGNMHEARLHQAYKSIPTSLFNTQFEVIDWGCGQALGTVVLFDFLKEQGLENNIKCVTLIEPASFTLQRAELHASIFIDKTVELNVINSYFEKIDKTKIESKNNRPVLHIFSNILDVEGINLKILANIVDSTVETDNYLVCVGPMNQGNNRLDAFVTYFDEDKRTTYELFESRYYKEKNMSVHKTCKIVSFKLEPIYKTHLIPIEYYPSVQFQAAYELDIVGKLRKAGRLEFNAYYTHFDVAAPFDLGASVYDDIHPVFAVLSNIITRGLPTKTSILIEDLMLDTFKISQKVIELGEIKYQVSNPSIEEQLIQITESFSENNCTIDNLTNDLLPIVFTPIAVARFQKMLVEAILTEKLSLQKERWEFLVEEIDVPFAAIAVKDFQELFNNLVQLSVDYESLRLPDISLTVITNSNYTNSPLHLNARVTGPDDKETLKKTYDLVVTQAIFQKSNESIEAFSKYKCYNLCYFNIRSITKHRTERDIYTSSLIKYKELVTKDNQGRYSEVEESKVYLKYFLQLLFRKEAFRPGQLPILDRALRKLPVIGLLPTGGGKSLTYQIAALLQPGVTIIIDPLKSLMKDQKDGLVNNGIDNCAYINSTDSKEEKVLKENQFESSRLLFVFLSPERLSIESFRERLHHMHDHNVYFSYGVIDEVHCVSEWGHDFRFSYLHLGRNLYNYVRAKNGEISLFGLTATASFDVLADVERELSGQGAFNLDADVIVRYENTNRLELQYKIEKVEAKFTEDKFYDQNKVMPASLPRAINIQFDKPAQDCKSDYLAEYFKKIPNYITELQTTKNIAYIKDEFVHRQSDSEGSDYQLETEMPNDYYVKKELYKQAGIVFCPHVNGTGISVNVNHNRLIKEGVIDVGSFSGKDNDNSSMINLELFRDSKKPIMIATKAFGLGIDKPNVRFTVNMNYSSSLEAFVQEAGRAGRDRRLALTTILVSDYKLAMINKKSTINQNPIGLIRNKWFYYDDLIAILKHFKVPFSDEDLFIATPSNDIAKLHCSKDNKTFGFNECALKCNIYNTCKLGKVSKDAKGWFAESDLMEMLKGQGISIGRKYFQYLSPDYQNVMYFFNNSFKGDVVEIANMNNLLNNIGVDVKKSGQLALSNYIGFLKPLLQIENGQKIIVYVPYTKDPDDINPFNPEVINYCSDISKAIYRMTCIDLIEDFTQDYKNTKFRIVLSKKTQGKYFDGLRIFLERYYSKDRAEIEINQAKNYSISNAITDPIEAEIQRCLEFLTQFIYDKISEKRKRAIDEMRNFCIEGLNEKESWLVSNEKLKDYLFYYFNSKYAKIDYVTDKGEPFSLLNDTNEGKESDSSTLFKFMRVIDDDVVGFGVPLDNVKHLYGAVRLISRSLTDSNPSLALLEVFCLVYLGTRGNDNLEQQLENQYIDGMTEFSKRESLNHFWIIFNKFNELIYRYFSDKNQFMELKNAATISVHTNQIKIITNIYIE